jgi:hypothetical protein
MQKAIEEAKKFVCTTKDRIVKDAKEFIQNVDWKKVAIGVAGTLAVAAVVVATGGAAAPVLIGAAASAGISTGTTVVSGVIQGKSPAEIAKDASGAFMWGAIGGAAGGGTTEVLKDVGSNVLGKVGKKLVEDGVDMALDLTQTATENGGLTGKDVLFSAVTSFGGDLVGAAKTNSTARNQLIDGATDNRAIKDAVGDSLTDNNTSKKALNSFDDRGYKPKPGERTLDGYVKNSVSTDAELSLSTNSSGFNNHDGITGGEFKRFGSEEHAGLSPHVHQPIRNEAPNGNIYGSVGSKTSNGGVTSPTEKDVKQLYQYLNNGKYQ